MTTAIIILLVFSCSNVESIRNSFDDALNGFVEDVIEVSHAESQYHSSSTILNRKEGLVFI